MIFMEKATIQNIAMFMSCIGDFCSLSGQKMNTSKSKILFSPNTDQQLAAEICHIVSIEATNDLGKYLGIPLQSKRVTKATFQEIISRIQTKLSQWKANQLSFAGRQVLVQSVSSIMATHIMQIV